MEGHPQDENSAAMSIHNNISAKCIEYGRNITFSENLLSNYVESCKILCDTTHSPRDQIDTNECERVTLLSAILTKYGETHSSCNMESGILALRVLNDHLPGKRRASGGLELLVLNDQQIEVCGNLLELHHLVHTVTELDLAKNSLSDWQEIMTIFGHMPLLRHCNLSHNPLTRRHPSIAHGQVFRLTSLVLNATDICWTSLLWILSFLPTLEELHISLNDYSESFCTENGAQGPTCMLVNVPSELRNLTFSSVHVLHANKCKIPSWSALVAIARHFPCLESLVAVGNPVSCLGTREEVQEVFGCLHTLNMKRWQLQSWEEFDKLRFFPMLYELRSQELPIVEHYDEDTRRQLVIARLPEVSVLNGSAVTTVHREDAERFFIRYYLAEPEKPERYYELESIHGRLEPLVDLDLSPQNEATVRITLDKKYEYRQISLVQSVGQFKKSLQEFAGFAPGRMRLFYKDKEMFELHENMGVEELRFPKQMLFTLNVVDDDEFIIEEKPVCVTRTRTTSSASSQPNSPVKASEVSQSS